MQLFATIGLAKEKLMLKCLCATICATICSHILFPMEDLFQLDKRQSCVIAEY